MVPFQEVRQFSRTVETERTPLNAEPARRLTLQELIDKFTEMRKNDVQVWRHEIAMRHLIEFAGDIHVDKVTPQVIALFRDDLLSKRATGDEQGARRGVNNDMRHIRVVFRYAYRQGIIPSHPFDRVAFFKVSKPVPDVLTREELNAMRLHLAKEDRLVFHFIRFTGLRVAEACEVRIKDVDLAANEINLYHTKNGEQVNIPLPRQLRRIATKTAWLQRDPNDKVIKYTRWTVTHHFRAAMKASGINKKMPTHIFRHTAGRRILERYYTTGNARAIAKKFLRHKTDTMTEYYQQVYVDDLRKAMESVEL